MSEQNSLKVLLSTARNEVDLDLFLYTASGVVGTSGIVEIVADAMRSDLVKAISDWFRYNIDNYSRPLMARLMELASSIKHSLVCFLNDPKAMNRLDEYGQPLIFDSESLTAFENICNAYGGNKRDYSEEFCRRVLRKGTANTGLFSVLRLGNYQNFVVAERHPITLNGTWKSRQTFVNHIFNFIRSN